MPTDGAGAGAMYAAELVAHNHSCQSSSPTSGNWCFCGNPVEEGGIYCSVACARYDAINSLCYKTHQPPLFDQDIDIQQAGSLTQTPSQALLPSSSSTSASAAIASDDDHWHAPHYRPSHADLRKQERRDERRRRRAEGSSNGSMSSNRSTVLSTTSSISSRALPDLVGGGGHSRNPSAASSVTSFASSAFSLSRNPSVASNHSKRGLGGGFNVDSIIMETEGEQEWLRSESPKPYGSISLARQPHHKRLNSRSASGRRKKNTPDLPLGMGQDMRDVLEEIIQMEQSYLFGPPRTPSPFSNRKGTLPVPDAPDVSVRGHRSTVSQNALAPPHTPAYQPQRGPRQSSLFGMHQSSLSESHTALYLATASPAAAETRSASPRLEARRSLVFTADSAGPSINVDTEHLSTGIPSLTLPPRNSEANSPMVTPMNRRFVQNRTPKAIHPSMDGWRFPSPMNAATPTRGARQHVPDTPLPMMEESRGIHGMGQNRCPSPVRIAPALLWPPQSPSRSNSPRLNLAPSLFPSSPVGIPQSVKPLLQVEHNDMARSDTEDDIMDVEMGGSPRDHGNSTETSGNGARYLLVPLETEVQRY
ncbi:hypothetical protein I305_03867 [Cryptococcus gattii E566]|uniref:Uncharacterized protein n=2 Tax=Cryptococcus gattii TaxID=37769 RepID=E6R4M5_CRYGW|nr:Hypothetical protein CGB_D7520W [Cryptococcus gattii WM276]ADV22010.1 Hypothetical protein CGB_D7520W [Cryptococcus gattii WM276]KIR80433.1 hypothetical protein I306_02409 [Cryptococcus gattii EJB2]KIY33477.1 hypothetical protein I305_03867 [Cryptococcus gattii E566]KJE00434.1 hypothetical protein I311_05978 [Cryptococcus gattii NT-10]